MAHARVLASKPISSLVESKGVILAALTDEVAAARAREAAAFKKLLGAPDQVAALAALAKGAAS